MNKTFCVSVATLFFSIISINIGLYSVLSQRHENDIREANKTVQYVIDKLQEKIEKREKYKQYKQKILADCLLISDLKVQTLPNIINFPAIIKQIILPTTEKYNAKMQLQLFFDANKENLYNIDFKNCIFSNLWLDNANFEGSNFYHVDFSNSKLIDSNFKFCRFSFSDFAHTDLSGSNLDFAKLYNCKFNNTNLASIASKKLIIYGEYIKGPVYFSDKKIEEMLKRREMLKRKIFANNNRGKNIYFVRDILGREILIQNDLDDRICEKFLETDIRKIGKMIYKGLLKNGIENEELEYNPEMTRWTLRVFFNSYNDEFRIYTINHKKLKKKIPEWYKINFSDYFIHFFNFISKFLSSPKSNLSFMTF